MNNRINILAVLLMSAFLLSAVSWSVSDDDNNPLNLQSIMRLLSADMQMINEGIFTENYRLIEEGAAAINEHPPLSEDTRGLIRETLENRMQTFARFDKLVHDTADSIRSAAEDRQMGRILEQYQIIQRGCVSCHESFRSELTQARLESR